MASRLPFADMIRHYSGNVLKGMGARYIDSVFFNVFGVFSIGYLTTTVQVSRTQALLGVMASALVMCATIPLFGASLGRSAPMCCSQASCRRCAPG